MGCPWIITCCLREYLLPFPSSPRLRRSPQSRSNSRSGLPSGASLALRSASANFFSNRSSLFFSASTDCLKIDSLRSSCARMAYAAVSRSSNIRLRGAGVWLTTSPVAASILSMAPQSGHATSKICSFVFAISIRNCKLFRQALHRCEQSRVCRSLHPWMYILYVNKRTSWYTRFMEVPITQFRRDLFSLINQALEGREVWVTHKGRRLKIVPEGQPVSRLSRITPMDVINYEAGGLENT